VKGRLTATLIGILLVCALAGGVGAFVIGRQDAAAVAATTDASLPPSFGPDSGSATSSAGTSGSLTASSSETISSSSGTDTGDPGSSSPSATEQPMTSSPSAATTTSPEGMSVTLAGVAADDPQATEIRDLLQRHFDAINTRDYELWAGTVTKEQSAALRPERWLKEYSTTSDSDISVIVIDNDPRQVQLTFRSRQAPELAPDKKSDCVIWSVIFPLATVYGELRIGPSLEDRARYRPCHGP
jgi:hypothetical protein